MRKIVFLVLLFAALSLRAENQVSYRLESNREGLSTLLSNYSHWEFADYYFENTSGLRISEHEDTLNFRYRQNYLHSDFSLGKNGDHYRFATNAGLNLNWDNFTSYLDKAPGTFRNKGGYNLGLLWDYYGSFAKISLNSSYNQTYFEQKADSSYGFYDVNKTKSTYNYAGSLKAEFFPKFVLKPYLAIDNYWDDLPENNYNETSFGLGYDNKIGLNHYLQASVSEGYNDFTTQYASRLNAHFIGKYALDWVWHLKAQAEANHSAGFSASYRGNNYAQIKIQRNFGYQDNILNSLSVWYENRFEETNLYGAELQYRLASVIFNCSYAYLEDGLKKDDFTAEVTYYFQRFRLSCAYRTENFRNLPVLVTLSSGLNLLF